MALGFINPVSKLTEGQIEKYSNALVNLVKDTIAKEANKVEAYVTHLKELNPQLSKEKLAYKIINRRSLKSGAISGVCSVGGFATVPFTLPPNMYINFRIQARMVMAIAYLYGWDVNDEDTQMDILMVMGGNASVEAAKKVGVKVTGEFCKKAVKKHITRETMKKINKVLSRKIITKAGEKSLTSFAKLVPLIGAPVGGSIDFVGTQMMGRTALKYYRG